MDNASTEFSLEANSALVKEVTDHLPVSIFVKYHMDAEKPVPVVNLPPVIFIGGTIW